MRRNEYLLFVCMGARTALRSKCRKLDAILDGLDLKAVWGIIRYDTYHVKHRKELAAASAQVECFGTRTLAFHAAVTCIWKTQECDPGPVPSEDCKTTFGTGFL